MEEIKIEILKKEVKTKNGSFDKFITKLKNGKWAQVHFEKSCRIPASSGFLTIKKGQFNIRNRNKNGYECIEFWLKDYVDFDNGKEYDAFVAKRREELEDQAVNNLETL